MKGQERRFPGTVLKYLIAFREISLKSESAYIILLNDTCMHGSGNYGGQNKLYIKILLSWAGVEKAQISLDKWSDATEVKICWDILRFNFKSGFQVFKHSAFCNSPKVCVIRLKKKQSWWKAGPNTQQTRAIWLSPSLSECILWFGAYVSADIPFRRNSLP